MTTQPTDVAGLVERLKAFQMALSSPRDSFMAAFVKSYGPGGGTSLASDISHLATALTVQAEELAETKGRLVFARNGQATAEARATAAEADRDAMMQHAKDWHARADAAKAALSVAVGGLEFYANPETYHACAFMFDRPTGGWDEDFGDDHGHPDYERPMPGTLARTTLSRVSELGFCSLQLPAAPSRPCGSSRDVAADPNGGASRPEWMDDRDRASFAVNSVLNRVNEARTAEHNCRRAFRKPYMAEVATWVADVYAEVGDIWQARLRELRLGTEDAGQPSQQSVGEGSVGETGAIPTEPKAPPPPCGANSKTGDQSASPPPAEKEEG